MENGQQNPALCLSRWNGPKTHRITTNLERKHPRHNLIPPLDFIALTHNGQIPGESLSRELRRKPDPAPSCWSRCWSQPEPLPKPGSPSSPPGLLVTSPCEPHLLHPSHKRKKHWSPGSGFNFSSLPSDGRVQLLRFAIADLANTQFQQETS